MLDSNVTDSHKNAAADSYRYIPWEQLVTVDMPADKEDANSSFKQMPLFCCSKCNRIYVRENGLRQHIRFECGQIPKFSCTLCFKKFHRNSTLKRHVQTVHTKQIIDKKEDTK